MAISEEKIQARKAFIVRLRDEHPAFVDPVPLETGVRQKLMDRYPDTPRTIIRGAMRWWCSRLAYRQALAEPGSMRHTLDGTEVEPVSDEHRATALRPPIGRESASDARTEPDHSDV